MGCVIENQDSIFTFILLTNSLNIFKEISILLFKEGFQRKLNKNHRTVKLFYNEHEGTD